MRGRSRIAHVGHKDLAPVGGAGSAAHILHVENKVAEILVEDARLNLVGRLRGRQRLLHVEDGLVGAGSDVERIHQPQQRAADCHDGGHADKVGDAQARGADGDDFAVGGQAAQSQQNAHQHRHGDRDPEQVGQGEEKDLQHIGEGGAVANHHFEDLRKAGDEQDEGEQRASDQCVGENLAEDVAGEDAHREVLLPV